MGVEGRESLSRKVCALVESVQLLVGGERHLQEFPGFKGERFVLKANLKEMLNMIQKVGQASCLSQAGSLCHSERDNNIVVLASGDRSEERRVGKEGRSRWS